ncbi:MAG: phosphatidate cytidylyltransferase [Candidatus Pelagibacter sp.]
MKHEFQKRVFSSFILIPIAFYFIIKGSFFFTFFISICLLITLYEWHMMSKKMSYYIIGIIFILISFYSVFLLRNYDQFTNILDPGLTFFLIVTLICVFTDLGGYVFGKIFKGPKLTKISPNKTYAGMFGGFFLSIISINLFVNYTSLNLYFTNQLFIFVILVSAISQIGDILISFFKRKSKIKNTGKIIPGHGGLLDRIDGMLLAFPFSYFLILIGLNY